MRSIIGYVPDPLGAEDISLEVSAPISVTPDSVRTSPINCTFAGSYYMPPPYGYASSSFNMPPQNGTGFSPQPPNGNGTVYYSQQAPPPNGTYYSPAPNGTTYYPSPSNNTTYYSSPPPNGTSYYPPPSNDMMRYPGMNQAWQSMRFICRVAVGASVNVTFSTNDVMSSEMHTET